MQGFLWLGATKDALRNSHTHEAYPLATKPSEVSPLIRRNLIGQAGADPFKQHLPVVSVKLDVAAACELTCQLRHELLLRRRPMGNRPDLRDVTSDGVTQRVGDDLVGLNHGAQTVPPPGPA